MARSARSTPISMDNPGEDWDLNNAVRPTIAADRPFRPAGPFQCGVIPQPRRRDQRNHRSLYHHHVK